MITKLANGELYSEQVGNKVVVRPHNYSESYDVELVGVPAKILTLMMMNQDELVKMSDIIEQVWAGQKEMCPRAVRLVDVYVVKIRSFLVDCKVKVELIKAFHYLYLRTKETKTLQSSEICQVH